MNILKGLVLATCFFLQGCLSITTTFDATPKYKTQIYSGSALWHSLITDWYTRKDKPEAIEYIAFYPFLVVDVPLCLVADTLFLPYKFYYRATNPAPIAPVKQQPIKPLSPAGQ